MGLHPWGSIPGPQFSSGFWITDEQRIVNVHVLDMQVKWNTLCPLLPLPHWERVVRFTVVKGSSVVTLRRRTLRKRHEL